MEWIDPVRFLSNASSGKMGYCIAQELQGWLPQVTYICGNVRDKYRHLSNSKTVAVETTNEMLEAVWQEMQEKTLLVMAAAPLDYRPKQEAREKIKKEKNTSMTLEFIANRDILKSISQRIQETGYQDTALVGFAAETNDLEKHAITKLNRKGLDYIVGNYVGKNQQGFGENESSIEIFSQQGSVHKVGPLPKEELAREISQFLKKQYI